MFDFVKLIVLRMCIFSRPQKMKNKNCASQVDDDEHSRKYIL